MPSRGYVPPAPDSVVSNTDILGDLPQRVARQELIPRIARKTQNSVNVAPHWFELFSRLRTGRRCSCFETTDDASGTCKICFKPGSLVRTQSGYKPIEAIRTGEMVLSHDGMFHKVTATFKNRFDGELVTFTSSVSTNTISVTPEHPFLLMRGTHKLAHGCGPKCDAGISKGYGTLKLGEDGRPDVTVMNGGRFLARVQVEGKRRKSLGGFATREEAINAIDAYKSKHFKPSHTLDWDDACNVTERDWLVAQWPYEVKDVDFINIPKKFTTGKFSDRRLGPSGFKVSKKFLWMIGLYLAEGSTGSRQVCFSLHKNETKFQRKLLRFFSKHGYNPYVASNTGNGVNVVISSTSLANWFSSWLGRGSHNKAIPEEFMLLPNKKLKSILKGIDDGDGVKHSRKEISQTSEKLALQMSEILHRLGAQPLVRRWGKTKKTPKGNERKQVYGVSWATGNNSHANRKGRWEFEDRILAKVRNVKKEPYSGYVYNIEVEETNTYVVNGVITHNCYATGIVGGYQKRGTKIEVFDVTMPNVAMMNVGIEFSSGTRPLPFKLRDTAVYGEMDWNIDLLPNVGKLDTFQVLKSSPQGSAVYVYVRAGNETVYVLASKEEIEKRLNGTKLYFRAVLVRRTPASPLPRLVSIRFAYRTQQTAAIRIDLPLQTYSMVLEEFGIVGSFSTQSFVADNTVKNFTTEDFLYDCDEGATWKVVEVQKVNPLGVLTSWNLTTRIIHPFEPYRLVPLGEVPALQDGAFAIRSRETEADMRRLGQLQVKGKFVQGSRSPVSFEQSNPENTTGLARGDTSAEFDPIVRR